MERLRRRIEGYRRHQNNCIPRFEHSFNGIVDHNLQETLLLKQRFLENKPKRPVKKSEKKPAESSLTSLSLPKFPKCSVPEENTDGGFGANPEAQKQQAQKQQHENMTKFSVEIVQQLEFTATSTNSQISTNVTVKALNTSIKGDVPPSPQSPQRNLNMVECKQEPENIDFVDLEECAAALEKDAAANGGNSFLPGLSDLIGGDAAGSISSDAFKDLISEISEYNPEFMKDFDLGGGGDTERVEESVKLPGVSGLPLMMPPLSKPELSPAAQTLKNMAEQHQHKAQMGISFSPRLAHKPYSYPQADLSGYKVAASNMFLGDNIKQEAFPSQGQGSPLPYCNSPTGKTPSPQRISNQQPPPLQQVFKQQMQYQQQFTNVTQYRQPMKGPQQVNYQPQPQRMPASGPMLRAPQPHYLPRAYLGPPPQRSYKTARPAHIQPQENWVLHQPPSHQPPHQLRLHPNMAPGFARQVVSTVPPSSLPFSYVNTFPNFGVHQTGGFSQSLSSIAPEFNLDFLEQLPHTGEATNLSEQELFSSLDSGTTFNFQDIL